MLELQRQGIALRVYALADPRETQIDPEAARLRPQVIYLHDPHQRIRSWCRLMGGAALQALQHPLGALRAVWALATVHRSLPSLRHAIEGLWLARHPSRHALEGLPGPFSPTPA